MNLIQRLYSRKDDLLNSGFNAFVSSFGLKPVDMYLYRIMEHNLYSADHMAVGTFIGTYFTRRNGFYTPKSIIKTLAGVTLFSLLWEGSESVTDFSLGNLDTLIDIGSNIAGAFIVAPFIEGAKKVAYNHIKEDK